MYRRHDRVEQGSRAGTRLATEFLARLSTSHTLHGFMGVMVWGAGPTELPGEAARPRLRPARRPIREKWGWHGTIMDSLQGHLLIASPSLLDPNFARTVVLI